MTGIDTAYTGILQNGYMENQACVILSEFQDVFQPFNSGGSYDIDNETQRNFGIRCFQLKQNGVTTWNVQMKNLSNVQELEACVALY